jgi:DNA-binding GntR family transcriptional regulator
VREQIITGTLAPGRKLTEQELSTNLGVSRTPIREALRLLLGEQLVEKRSSGGFAVTEVSIEDVQETYNVRALLEGLMAREATEKATDADLAVLETRLSRMHEVETDHVSVATLSRQFHAKIASVAANRWANTTLDQLRGHVDRYRAMAALGGRRPVESVREHEDIYEAMVQRDALRAEALMRQHVEASAGPAIAVIKEWLPTRQSLAD